MSPLLARATPRFAHALPKSGFTEIARRSSATSSAASPAMAGMVGHGTGHRGVGYTRAVRHGPCNAARSRTTDTSCDVELPPCGGSQQRHDTQLCARLAESRANHPPAQHARAERTTQGQRTRSSQCGATQRSLSQDATAMLTLVPHQHC